MHGRARIAWGRKEDLGRGFLAARRLTRRPTRVPHLTLPCRTFCRQPPAAGDVPAFCEASTLQNTPGLLDGFCTEPCTEEQIAISSGGSLLFLRVSDIEWLEETRTGVAVHAGSEMHLLDDTLSAVAARLPAGRFLRFGPSTLVNTEQIKELQPLCDGASRVLLRKGGRLLLSAR
jgi:DNA-binding LytR/AlgR family response regulator